VADVGRRHAGRVRAGGPGRAEGVIAAVAAFVANRDELGACDVGDQFRVTDRPKNGADVLVGVADEYTPPAPSAKTLIPVPSDKL